MPRCFAGYIGGLSLVIVEVCVNLNRRPGLIIPVRGHPDCSCNRYKLNLFVLIRGLLGCWAWVALSLTACFFLIKVGQFRGFV